MSHTVKIKTLFKDFSVFKKALSKFGWTIKEKSKIRTYPSDANRNDIYDYVAVNPKSTGYDIGIKIKPDGELELFCDYYDGSIQASLGNDLNQLRQEYSTQLAVDELTFNGYVVQTTTDSKGNVIIEAESLQ